MTIQHLLSLLHGLSEVSAWEIRKLRKKSHQRYLVFDQIESQRVVETEKFIVTLHKEYEIKGQKVLFIFLGKAKRAETDTDFY